MLVALAGVHIYEEGLLKELITSHRVLGPLDGLPLQWHYLPAGLEETSSSWCGLDATRYQS